MTVLTEGQCRRADLDIGVVHLLFENLLKELVRKYIDNEFHVAIKQSHICQRTFLLFSLQTKSLKIMFLNPDRYGARQCPIKAVV